MAGTSKKIKQVFLNKLKNNVLDSKQMAKNLGISHKNLLAESTKLFDNIYAEQMKVNKKIFLELIMVSCRWVKPLLKTEQL